MASIQVETIQPNDIQNRWKKYYVSFPPFPALIFLPFIAIFGIGFNDVLLTVILAALAPTLLFVVLRKLAARGDSPRSETDDLWLTAMFGFGTVYLYASVIGSVWYTAHVTATVLTGLFVLASLDARYPTLAGTSTRRRLGHLLPLRSVAQQARRQRPIPARGRGSGSP